ncbi:hypothetical protein [Nocardia sp. NPDC057440]|uniref:hypothetical protein n=1 Tax=Nocardia sp. NPDC057440 TaxID=3346134 RepID=UPI00366F99BC
MSYRRLNELNKLYTKLEHDRDFWKKIAEAYLNPELIERERATQESVEPVESE